VKSRCKNHHLHFLVSNLRASSIGDVSYIALPDSEPMLRHRIPNFVRDPDPIDTRGPDSLGSDKCDLGLEGNRPTVEVVRNFPFQNQGARLSLDL
jgi:hypothetical protein